MKEMVERLGVMFWGLVLVGIIGWFVYMGYVEFVKEVDKVMEGLSKGMMVKF